MFMPAAEASVAAQFGPPRPLPERIGQVLGILRTFIAYGNRLADTLRQHANNPRGFPGFFSVSAMFRTGDVTLILERIARGLLRAAALEARLNRLADRGRDLTPSPVRMPASRRSATVEPAVLMDDPAGGPAPKAEACLAPPPTRDDIIARDRRRPIGAILVDICHDLGIAPGDMDHTTWNQLRRHIIECGGSLVTLLFKRPGPATGETPDGYQGYFTGPYPIPTDRSAIAPPAWPEPQSPAPALAGTGPP